MRIISRFRGLITLAVLAAVLIYVGADGLITAIRNPQPTSLTCAEALTRPTLPAWVRLTDCQVKLDDISFAHKRARDGTEGPVTHVAFPLVDTAHPDRVRVVLWSDDAAALAQVSSALANKSTGAMDGVRLLLSLANRVESKPIQGLLLEHWTSDRERTQVQGLGLKLEPNFELLNNDAHPTYVASIVMLSLGVVCALGFVYLLRAPSRAASETSSQSAHDAGRPASSVAGIAGLLLVNALNDSETWDSSTAPPLGSRAEVRTRLLSAMPEIRLDEAGRARLERPGYALRIELGPADAVPALSIDLAGVPAVLALKHLMLRTGWRAYSLERGAFVDADRLTSLLTNDAPIAPLLASPSTEAPRDRSSLLRGASVTMVVVAIIAGVATTAPSVMHAMDERRIAWNEGAAIDAMLALGRANMIAHATTGGSTFAPATLAASNRLMLLEQSALPPEFALDTRRGYTFEFRGQPIPLGDRRLAIVPPPAYDQFVYIATPQARDKTGRRTFAYYSNYLTVFARADAQTPTAADEKVGWLDYRAMPVKP